MATIMKDISGIDPLTFSLINFNQYNTLPSGLRLYKNLIRKFNPTAPSLLSYSYRSSDLREGYDYYVLFPEYSEYLGRPEWLTSNPDYRSIKVKSIADFQLIQAYKSDTSGKLLQLTQSHVPSDQYYLTKDQKETTLYLFPGEYEIVYRNIDYQIIKSFKMQVKAKSGRHKR